MPAVGLHGVFGLIRLRNIKVGRPAVANRLHIREAVRFESRTFIYNLEGRQTNTWCSTTRIKDAHHEGRNYYAPGCTHNPVPLRHVRIASIDTRKLRWCSIDSAAFH